MEVVADPSMDRYGGTDSGLAGRPESLISARAGLGLDSITEFPSSKPLCEELQAGLYTRLALDCTYISCSATKYCFEPASELSCLRLSGQ